MSVFDPPVRILSVILTYHPDPAILRRLCVSLLPQTAQILVVDNGGQWDFGACFREFDNDERAYLEFLRLPENVGVAAGYNRGIAWSKDHGFSHVLLMDQDSLPAPDMVEKLSLALARLAQDGVRVAAVGPQQVDSYTGTTSPFVRLGMLVLKKVSCSSSGVNEIIETDFLITSGSLIPMQVFHDIGPLERRFFVDHVDTEWVLRAKHKGYRVFGVCDAVMRHSLGTGTLRFWFLRWRNVALHSPERHYYIFRNSFLLFRQPYATWRWCLNDTIRLTYIGLFFAVFAPSRVQRLKMIAKGIWDGLRGAEGPIRH